MNGGQYLLAFALEDWARDNIVRAFVLGWVAAVSVWLFLDWLGNPSRGRFRAEGPMRSRGIRGRLEAWRDERDHDEAEIREALRATYGKSSLRLTWSNLDETAATAYDEAQLSPVPRLLELGAESSVVSPMLRTESFEKSWDASDGVEIDLTDTPAAQTTPEPEIDLTDTPAAQTTPEPEIDLTATPAAQTSGAVRIMVEERTEAEPEEVGWQPGDHPTSRTLKGANPTRTTVRSRAWKNAARFRHAMGGDNQHRMKKGRPPRRWNPITRQSETAKIDVDNATFDITWTMSGTDPFADEHNRPGVQRTS